MQPAITPAEYDEAERVAKADRAYRAALAARGIDDVELVMIDAWTVGTAEDPGVRAARGLSWLRSDLDGDNGYARPIGNLVVVVDLAAMRVVRVDDHGALPVPSEPGDYRDGGGRPYREQRPLDIVQPEGPTFTIEGRLVRWSHWRMRIGFTAREGLVLHEVGWEQDGEVRPVLHRGLAGRARRALRRPEPDQSLQERLRRRRVRDRAAGDTLELGCDCLGEVRYLDG